MIASHSICELLQCEILVFQGLEMLEEDLISIVLIRCQIYQALLMHPLDVILELHRNQIMSMNILLCCFLAPIFSCLITLTLMLLDKVFQAELFKGILVLVPVLIEVLDIDSSNVDVIDSVEGVSCDYPHIWEVRLVDKHVLP
jgi:hypothetical protein